MHYERTIVQKSNWEEWINQFFEVLFEGFHRNQEKNALKNFFCHVQKSEVGPLKFFYISKFSEFFS